MSPDLGELTAAACAQAQVAAVRIDPAGRLALLNQLYAVGGGTARPHLPYRRAAISFMGWQLRRGLLDPVGGSAWWSGVNERLLRDGWEAAFLAQGLPHNGTTPSVAAALEFIRRPSSARWYRAHNASVVGAYLDHHDLAEKESRTERFFINLVLVRVLYAHALVASPRLALGPLAPLAGFLGDPRLGMTGIYLSLSRILPASYPLGDNVERYVAQEHGFGRLVDVGVIQPRLERLYEWASRELDEPRLGELLTGDIPSYAWHAEDRAPWFPRHTVLTRAARRVLPVMG